MQSPSSNPPSFLCRFQILPLPWRHSHQSVACLQNTFNNGLPSSFLWGRFEFWKWYYFPEPSLVDNLSKEAKKYGSDSWCGEYTPPILQSDLFLIWLLHPLEQDWSYQMQCPLHSDIFTYHVLSGLCLLWMTNNQIVLFILYFLQPLSEQSSVFCVLMGPVCVSATSNCSAFRRPPHWKFIFFMELEIKFTFYPFSASALSLAHDPSASPWLWSPSKGCFGF